MKLLTFFTLFFVFTYFPTQGQRQRPLKGVKTVPYTYSYRLTHINHIPLPEFLQKFDQKILNAFTALN